MTFAYSETVISGSRRGIEGTSSTIQRIKTTLNQMGWTVYDDRTAQAGTNHKLIMTTSGESGTDNPWYLVMTSGSIDEVGFQISTDWNLGTHTIAGVFAPADATTVTLNTDEDNPCVLWVSGDLDALALLTRAQDNYDSVLVGRSRNFLTPAREPYGLYLIGTATLGVDLVSTTVRGIAGPAPTAITAGSDAETKVIAQTTTDSPYTLDGGVEPIYLALPVTWFLTDSATVGKGAVGFLRNVWSGPDSANGLMSETIIVVSGTSETYIAFDEGAHSLIIRRT